MKNRNSRKRGFTILEVALVIAIAGLIFLMMSVALPTLQRNQRDAKRREDVAMVLDAIEKYQTNNRGALPGATDFATTVVRGEYIAADTGGAVTATRDNTWIGFYRDYLGKSFIDPSGNYYNLALVDCTASPGVECSSTILTYFYNNQSYYSYDNHMIMLVKKATCSDGKAVGSSNPRKVAALYRLEGSGIYCSNT